MKESWCGCGPAVAHGRSHRLHEGAQMGAPIVTVLGAADVIEGIPALRQMDESSSAHGEREPSTECETENAVCEEPCGDEDEPPPTRSLNALDMHRRLRGRESLTPFGRPRARDPLLVFLSSGEGDRSSTSSESRDATLPGGGPREADAADFRLSSSR